MLKKLTDAFGVSGFESPVRDLIIGEIKDYCTQMTVDSMGNLKVYKKAKSQSSGKILLSAHMDEVGLIVTDITDDGYLKFASVGGIDPRVLISQRVTVNGHKGIISLKAVHLTDKEERQKPLSEKNLYIDLGTKSRAEAEHIALRGDYVAFDSEYIEFGNMIKAKALDDRLGCSIMIDILKQDWNIDLYCNFTVQEECGLRGAAVATRGINPDFAIVIEGTTCNDMTGVPEKLRVTKSGEGVAISILDSASKADCALVQLLVNAAEKHGVAYQFKASTAGGNDAGVIATTDGGIKVASVSVPCRYIHSPVSIMNKNDYVSCKKLIQAFLTEAEKGFGE